MPRLSALAIAMAVDPHYVCGAATCALCQSSDIKDEHLLAEMEQRVRRRPEVMKQRKQLVEDPFGTMQRWWEQGSFLMRGLEKVRTELSLTVLAYNLRRVLNLVGVPQLMATLG